MKNYFKISICSSVWAFFVFFIAGVGISLLCIYYDQMVVERLYLPQFFSKSVHQALEASFNPITAAEYLQKVLFVGLTANLTATAIGILKCEKSKLFYLVSILGTAVFAVLLAYDAEIFAFNNHIVLLIYVIFCSEFLAFAALSK